MITRIIKQTQVAFDIECVEIYVMLLLNSDPKVSENVYRRNIVL